MSRERLEHMGYGQVSDGRFATGWFRRSEQTENYFDHFTASIEMMVRQSARLVLVPWEDALSEFLRRVRGTALRWWLYGSAALAIRGLTIEPGDIDVNVSDTWLAGRLFDDVLVGPVGEMHGWVAKSGGRAFRYAIIEWLSDPLAELDDPAAPHEQGPLIASQLETVIWRGRQILVPPLSAQLHGCERRGLTGRADLIRAAMNASLPK